MRKSVPEILALIVASSLATSASADSDEASLVRAELPSGIRPLLALIIDTSVTDTVTVRAPFEPTRHYDGDCDVTRIYWRRGPGAPPDCQDQVGLEPYPADELQGLQCEAARVPLRAGGFHVAARAAQWRSTPSGGYWASPRASAIGAIECEADSDVELAWDRSPLAGPYIFYSGNYLNWLRNTLPTLERPYLEQLGLSLAMLRAASDLDVAWLRIAHDGGDGGYVAGAPMPAPQAADRLAALAAEAPGTGGTPLAEALVESALWLSGGEARFGTTDVADADAFESDARDRYRSPFSAACRPITLAFVTAGRANGDDLASSASVALPNFVADTGGCDADCLGTLASWVASGDLRTDLPGVQSVAFSFFDSERLGDPLAVADLAARSLQHDAAVPAPPQLSAPALISSSAGAEPADLLFAMSAPRAGARWHGNLFRYALRATDAPSAPPEIVDRDGEPAIGGDALPLPSSHSLWSDAPDANLLVGGAAARIPPAAGRELFAELGVSAITAESNRLVATNAAIQPEMLGLGAGETASVAELLDSLANDRRLGDYGAHAPAIATYSDRSRQVVFAANHDGWLQAFDAASGVELWAWMPEPLLPRLAALLRDESTTVRDHGIDGALVLHRYDPDGDGRIDPSAGEHFWLLFGLGRGGNRYYALDVADPDSPRLLWSFELPGDEELESRAEPVVTQIAVDGADQNADRWVVLLAGGYDRRFDEATPPPMNSSSALHLVDAASGLLLWSAGSAPDSSLFLPGVNASFTAAPRAMDIDGDGRLDRAYAIDVTGNLWRFDFASGRAPADLAQARRAARLGTNPQRFHGTPDVSMSRSAGGVRLAVSVGSGWHARPLDDLIVDRVYTIFDSPGDSAIGTLVDADLHDAGTAPDAMPTNARGWFRQLDSHGPGEKAIGPTVTFGGVLHLQTWRPLPIDPAAPCGPPRGTRNRYELDVSTGTTRGVVRDEEAIELPGSGLPVALRFGFPGDAGIGCSGCRPRSFGVAAAAAFDAGYAADPIRTSWRKLAPPPASR